MGIIINRKSHDCICNRDYNGGAGVIKYEHPSVSVFSPSKASSISSSGDIVDAQRLLTCVDN